VQVARVLHSPGNQLRRSGVRLHDLLAMSASLVHEHEQNVTGLALQQQRTCINL